MRVKGTDDYKMRGEMYGEMSGEMHGKMHGKMHRKMHRKIGRKMHGKIGRKIGKWEKWGKIVGKSWKIVGKLSENCRKKID
jgi:hypothetical protein